MEKTIENKVADTILQRETDTINIGGNDYKVYPPTVATLILVSELIPKMPKVDFNTENILAEVLHTAKDMRVIGKIAATLILGAKRIKANHMVEVTKKKEKGFVGWVKNIVLPNRNARSVSELDYLANELLENLSAKRLSEIISKQLIKIGIADFFGLTTSLYEANLTKRTREVEMTASGD